MGQPIVHLEIIGRDAPRLHAFYRDLFGWDVGPASGPEMGWYALSAAASSGIDVGIGQAPGNQTRVTAYVRVPDLQVAVDRAVELGGSVMMPPTSVPGGPTLAIVGDPDGNATGLMAG